MKGNKSDFELSSVSVANLIRVGMGSNLGQTTPLGTIPYIFERLDSEDNGGLVTTHISHSLSVLL